MDLWLSTHFYQYFDDIKFKQLPKNLTVCIKSTECMILKTEWWLMWDEFWKFENS